MKTLRILLTLALLFCASVAHAAVPPTMPYQGFVRDSVTGQPFTGQHVVSFTLFDEVTGGTTVWAEVDTLTFDGGVFTTALGDDESFTVSMFNDSSLFLETLVDGNSSGPRTQLVSVPFAIHAAFADSTGNGGGSGDANWVANGDDISNTNAGYVGIGTTTPVGKLDIQDATYNTLRLLNTSLDFGNGVTGSYIAHQLYSRYGASSTGAVTGLKIVTENGGSGPTNGLVVMGGNVGIGTTNPQASLDVAGQNIVAKLGDDPSVVQLGGDANAFVGGYAASAGGNNSTYVASNLYYETGVSEGWHQPNSSKGTALALFQDGVFQVRTAGSGLGEARLHVGQDGNIGIGTTEPSSELTIRHDDDYNGPTLFLQNNASPGLTGTLGGQIVFGRTAAGGMASIRSESGDWYGQSYDLNFLTGHGEPAQERMRITSDGKVGIGTDNPQATLDVAGDLCVRGAKNRIVETPFGETKLNAVESAEAWFTTSDETVLKQGRVRVNLSPHFLSTVTISNEYPLNVDVTFYGPHGDWYVERDNTGFTIIDPDGSNAQVSWCVHARQKGYETWNLKISSDQARR